MRDTKDLPETAALQPVRKGHIGLIVAGSVITGLIVASGLAVVVFGGAAEPVITGGRSSGVRPWLGNARAALEPMY